MALVAAEEEDVVVVFFVDDCIVVAASFGSRVAVVVARPGVEVFVSTICVWRVTTVVRVGATLGMTLTVDVTWVASAVSLVSSDRSSPSLTLGGRLLPRLLGRLLPRLATPPNTTSIKTLIIASGHAYDTSTRLRNSLKGLVVNELLTYGTLPLVYDVNRQM